MNRRTFLIQAAAFIHLSQRSTANPFTLGVASGDPGPDSVVIWTRLAPDPLNGGGMPVRSVPVSWAVATDERMRTIVKRGTAQATPAWAHSVHVEVNGLEPARWYWYQFRAGAAESPIGRTRTMPARGSRPQRLSFAFASCQHYEQGLFTAYDHIAAEDLDLVIHLGDYIYESAAVSGRVRTHNSGEVTTLSDYRNRYALYKLDAHLQRAHAAFPWIVTWDDHEFANNYAGPKAEDGSSGDEFFKRRAAAYKAYFEHMPLRRSARPRGPNAALYRRVSFGELAEFFVLDTRQYRTDQPCGDGVKPICAEARDPHATLLGTRQERWLFDGFRRSSSRWNVLVQQVIMAPVDRAPGQEQTYTMDVWNGYQAARNRVLRLFADHPRSNPVVLTGDIHSNWVTDLKADFERPESAVVGTEFVGTSISSGGDGSDVSPQMRRVAPENPHVKFFNGQRGYVRCNITPERWTSQYRIVPWVTRPGSPVETKATFRVENGRPGAEPA